MIGTKIYQRRKGILLVGGLGSRLYPITIAVSKQLLPVYDKPMVYYPLTTLMLSGIREILVISTPQDKPLFKKLLGDGKQWGIEISYAIQRKPDGLAQAFIIGKDFVGKSPSALILGDNIYYGHGLEKTLCTASRNMEKSTIFAYHVHDPERYGVVEFDEQHNAVKIEEKPLRTSSHYAVTGLYFYDYEVCNIVLDINPSPRGELEITDVNRIYMKKKRLNVELMGRGITWIDTGTPEALLKASQFISTVENQQGLKIACPEEIAYHKGYIDSKQLKSLASSMKRREDSRYLLSLLKK